MSTIYWKTVTTIKDEKRLLIKWHLLITKSVLWTTPVKQMTAKTKKDSKGDYNDYKEVSEDDDKYWRAIEKIIIHSGFKTEALSWKGFDYALVKLSKSDY